MAFDFSSQDEFARTLAYVGAKDAAADAAALHDVVERGLPADALNTARRAIRELTDKTWAEVLAISLTQFKRLRASEKPLSADVGSQLVMFVYLLQKAEEIFGGRQAALDWFNGEQMALGGRRPMAMLDTYIGAALVERSLKQMDYGVYM